MKSVLRELNDDIPTDYLSARKAEDVTKISKIADDNQERRFVIDDFHRLAKELQEQLADIAKLAADGGEGAKFPKLIIIGINRTGSDLIQMVPDIAKRTGIHKILPGEKRQIEELVNNGCVNLNIELSSIEPIFGESRGDYWLTQQLCQSICIQGGVYETQDKQKSINFDLEQIRQSVIRRLDGSFRPVVKDFCRGRRFRPGNDPYFKLLRLVGQQETSIVDLNDLANSNPEVRGSINNIKDGRLTTLLDSKPRMAAQFYYNSDTKSFVIEDPALFYFLKHLDWEQIRAECGFRVDNSDYEYEIAISFAGEHRELADFIASSLGDLDVPVFYDRYYEGNFLGTALTTQFEKIFGEQSKYVLCLLDENHLKKVWPSFERRHFVPRLKSASVIPIYLDDSVFLGIPEDLYGIRFKYSPDDDDWKERAVDDIILKIIDKLSE